MPVVQSSYSENIAAAYAGMVANMLQADISTRICETAAGIAFGVAVGKGSADDGAVIGAGAAASFLGVSVRDVTLDPDDLDKYQQYANMAVITKGEIWVTAGGNVADGEDVTFVATTGVLSSAGTSGSQFAIAGARWMTTASSGQLAKLKLGGVVPAA